MNVMKLLAFGIALLVGAAVAAIGRAEPKYVGWSKVESARETREYKEKLRDNGALDSNAREFLEQTTLPQLALEENRPTIERTRRRIRELLLTDIGDDKTFADVSQLVADFMATVARDDAAEPVVRVNAMLLIGELKGKDGKPWPQSAPMLAAASADKSLPIAVRIAAMSGVARHLTAAGDGDEALAQTVGPAILGIVAEPLDAKTAREQEWLVSRALASLPAVIGTAPPNVATALAGILADPARSIDVRVRAAAALGRLADARSGLNVAEVVATTRALAVTALEVEEAAAATRRFEQQYRTLAGGMRPGGPGGMMPPAFGVDGMQPVAKDPVAIPEQACRRAAWRIATLATALLSSDGKTGLTVLLGEGGGQAKDVAGILREWGTAIDQTPDEQSVLDALDALRGPRPRSRPANRPARRAEDGGAEGGEGKGGKPAEERPADPNASPFDNPFGQ
jgi:hypothetical protein